MWRLLYPLRYFVLDNKEKRKIDIVATAILATMISLPFIILPGTSFFRTGGFLDKLLTLTAALTGFYVAALVAAATFSHPDLDNVIKSGPIALISKGDDGQIVAEHLTRREFICAVFAYLAFSSFMLSIIFSLLIAVSTVDLRTVAEWVIIGGVFKIPQWLILRDIVIVIVCAAISHMMVATSIGIYYLMDRLYRHDRKITTKKPRRSSGEAA